MTEPVILVGVDGGGTRCRARARQLDGTLIGECVTGTANLLAGVETALSNIVAAVTGALEAGGLGAADLNRCLVGMGLAGANIPELADRFLASSLPFRRTALEMDGWIACRGAHPGGNGAIAILGTGTAYVANIGGRFITIGGWGFHVGDQASGAWLGHQALRQSLLAFDGIIAATPLSDAILAHFDNKPDAMVAFGKTALPRDYGEFAPLVLDRADAGDPIATAIVDEAVGDIEASLRRLASLGADRISLFGGLAPRYAPRLSPAISAMIVPPASDALEGALQLAATLLPKEAFA
ncbi:N-acetylglucosamine kinase [Kaistia dalseonensis]|uniref:Glucosamine kinase n=1 Tax=Kaistia dalseonensis TaxID=410840 RepID=A0ABU0HBY1_9HYPH|nr:BadF/BadG/BcrA/BcrD ATPase family protein [Kaistia dalseonensis]MCX5497187.1 N-acetylglucosamine kinase [Kaistia dalseonensis]MDQ0439818.1 glucosamine kinase [Kaistia dalseonensis]